MSASRFTTWLMGLFLLGIGIGTSHLAYPSLRQWGILGTLFAGSVVCRKKARLRLLLGLPCALLAGITYIEVWRAHFFTFFPEHATFTAHISDAPDNRQTKTFLTVTPDAPLGHNLSGQPENGRLILYADRYPTFHYGDRVRVQGDISPPEKFNGFNYPLFLERFNVYGIIQQPHISLVEPARTLSIKGLLFSLRGVLEQRMQKYVVEPESSFLGGILLGSKRAIPQDIQDALKATGTSHIIAISGANITILLSLVLQVLPLYKRRAQFWATFGIASFVTILTGASASVLRGAYVATLGSYVRSCGRRAWATPLILFSLTLLLLNNPLLLVADPGFQLSFAAYAGLMYLGTPLSLWIERIPFTRSMPPVIQSSLSETLAATIGTVPLSFLIFGQLSLLGLVVNPLILWLLPPITALGLILIIGGGLYWLAELVTLPLWFLLHTVLSIIRWFGQFTFATIHWKP